MTFWKWKFFIKLFEKSPSKTLLLRGFETDTIKFSKQDRQLILTVCWHRTELRKAVARAHSHRFEIKTGDGDGWHGSAELLNFKLREIRWCCCLDSGPTREWMSEMYASPWVLSETAFWMRILPGNKASSKLTSVVKDNKGGISIETCHKIYLMSLIKRGVNCWRAQSDQKNISHINLGVQQ